MSSFADSIKTEFLSNMKKELESKFRVKVTITGSNINVSGDEVDVKKANDYLQKNYK